jgi:hypothetical protein
MPSFANPAKMGQPAEKETANHVSISGLSLCRQRPEFILSLPKDSHTCGAGALAHECRHRNRTPMFTRHRLQGHDLLILRIEHPHARQGNDPREIPIPKIVLRFTVDEKGETGDIEATSGHKLLREAAIENLQSWKFRPPSCACRVKDEATLVYKLSNESESAETPDVIVKWFRKTGGVTVQIEGYAPDWEP